MGVIQGSITLTLTLTFTFTFTFTFTLGNSQRVGVYQGSILEQDWSDGDVVFANSTVRTRTQYTR